MRTLLLFIFLVSVNFAKSQISLSEPYVEFETDSISLNASSKKRLETIGRFILLNPTLGIEFRSRFADEDDSLLNHQRNEVILRFLINQGIMSEHFLFETYPCKVTDNPRNEEERCLKDRFSMFVLDTSKILPCENNYGIKIHFKCNSLEIFETECDSIMDVFRIINDTKHEWAVCGVSKSNSEEDRKFARQRVDIVIQKLHELGIQGGRFYPFSNWHEEPKENVSRDWPYYPKWYEYEIGVYFQPYF